MNYELRLVAESREDTTNHCGTNNTCYNSFGRYMAVMEVCYGMTKVVVGLVVSVVPVPVRTTEVTPATTLVADATFPTGIKVTTTDVDVTGRTVLYHYMGASGYNMGAFNNCVWAIHLVMTTTTHLHATIVMHHHLSVATTRIVSVIPPSAPPLTVFVWSLRVTMLMQPPKADPP